MKKILYFILSVLTIFIGLLIIKSDYTKTIIIYGLLLNFLLCGSVTISFIFKKRIEYSIPAFLIIMFLYLYFFGIFNILRIGFYSFMILTISIFLFVILRLIKRREFRVSLKLILTPGLLVYIILYIIFALSSFDAAFYVWDEFTFWGLAAKNMYYLNNFYVLKGTTMSGCFYPPCPIMFIYFFSKFMNNYNQGIELFTMFIISFSFMLPLFGKSDFKDNRRNAILFIIMLIVPGIFCFNLFYKTIYADVFLGLLVSYDFILLFRDKCDRFDLISIYLSLLLLSMTKSIGIVLSILNLLFMFIYQFVCCKNKKKTIILFIIFGLLLCLFYISWKVYLNVNLLSYNNGYINVEPLNTSIKSMLFCMRDSIMYPDKVINKTFINFVDHFFVSKYYILYPIKINGYYLIIIFGILLSLLNNYYKKSILRFRTRIIVFYSLSYIILLQFAYYMKFSVEEASRHSSLERYIGTICIVIVLFMISTIFNERNKKNDKKNNKIITITLIGILLFAPVNEIFNATLFSANNNYLNRNRVANQVKLADYVIQRTTENDRLFVIHQTQSKDSFLIQLRYFMTPRYFPIVNEFRNDGKVMSGKFNSVEELTIELYDKYDYVLVINSDEYFNENYNSIFEKKEIQERQLYKIIKKNDNKVVLEKVE